MRAWCGGHRFCLALLGIVLAAKALPPEAACRRWRWQDWYSGNRSTHLGVSRFGAWLDAKGNGLPQSLRSFAMTVEI